jgi:hypothetical protein
MKTIESLRRRALAGAIPRSEVGWLEDESIAANKMADAVDLTLLSDGDQVQQAARTAHRRLRQVIAAAPAGGKSLTLQTDKFDDPFNRVSSALAKLEAKTATF